MKIEIKCRFSGKVLFEHTVENNNSCESESIMEKS